MTPLSLVLRAFPGTEQLGDEYVSRCPLCGPAIPLFVKERADGAVLVRCSEGCNSWRVLQAVGLTLKDVSAKDARSVEASATTGRVTCPDGAWTKPQTPEEAFEPVRRAARSVGLWALEEDTALYALQSLYRLRAQAVMADDAGLIRRCDSHKVLVRACLSVAADRRSERNGEPTHLTPAVLAFAMLLQSAITALPAGPNAKGRHSRRDSRVRRPSAWLIKLPLNPAQGEGRAL